jgi:hypothetical protein
MINRLDPMNLKAAVAYAAVLAFVLTVGGCGGPQLTVEPARTVDLQGTWRLDRTASDDAQALVAAALPKPKPKVRRGDGPRADRSDGGGFGDDGMGGRRSGGDPRSGGRGDGGGRSDELGSRLPVSRDDGPRWRDPGAMARAFAVPPVVLRIGGGPREVVVVQDGTRRAFTPGDDTPYSITDRYGTRTIRAGWDREEFVVSSRDPNGLEVTERFRRGAAPDTLVSQVTLKARGLDEIRVSSLYRRAELETVPDPADEGPPAPPR